MHRHVCLTGIALLLISVTTSAQTADRDPRIDALLAAISEDRLAATVARLQSFETRHTLSAQDAGGRGIGAAAAWMRDELQRASPRLQVTFDDYDIPGQGARIVRDVRIRNVVATLPGRSPRRVYVTAHYDSLARVPDRSLTEPSPGRQAGVSGSDRAGAVGTPPQAATGGFDWSASDHFQPGANDDGSGTALAMELARVFATSGIEFDATLVFVAFAGEEQGLVGALLHARKADEEGWRIDAVLNNDVVGNPVGGNGLVNSESVRVFSEGPEDSPSRQVARYMRRVAARYVPSHRVVLIARHDRFGRGGDHTAFNQHGFAAVRLTESNENYARQHSALDIADAVSAPYLARNARVNAASLASLGFAPPPPLVTDDRGRPMLDRGPTGYDAGLRWEASAGAVDYRVFWREAWTPDWQHEILVGNVTGVVLPNVSIDDFVFGVAAVGAAGHESLVSAYVNPPREEVTIEER